MLILAAGGAIWLAVPARHPWAKRMERAGLRNFHQVSAEVYRGARPEAAGLAELKRLGVRTVIDLAGFRGEGPAAAAVGLDYVDLRARDYRLPEETLVRFLRVVNDHGRAPFYVHCAEGENRTSTAIAVYRIAVQGWRPGEAVDEAADGGFGFAAGSKAELAEHIRGLDIERLKALARKSPASTGAD